MINQVVRVSPPRQRHFNGHVTAIRPSFGTFAGTVFFPNIASTIRLGSLAFLNATADMQLFIAGQPVQWRESTMSIDLIIGAVGKASFTLFTSSTYRPGVFDEVVFFRSGVRRFGGFVQSVVDNLIPSRDDCHEMTVNCVDYNGYLDRVVIATLYTIPRGALVMNIIVDIINTYLKQFGITLAGFATSGAGVGPILFHYVTAAQAIAQLVATAPAIYFWIDSNKGAHYSSANIAAPAGFGSAPFSLTDTSRNYFDFQVTIDGTLYRNKQWVLPSVNVLSLRVETFTGDGSTTGFFTLYVLSNPPVVTVNGYAQKVATLGGAMPAGWTWYFITGGQGVFQRPGSAPLTNLDTLQVAYPNPFALAVSAENDAEIAAKGLVEAIVQPQNVIDLAAAQDMATGLLAAYCPNPPETIVFTTDEASDPRWLSPGMSIPISKNIPPASGTYIIEEVQSQEYNLAIFKHTVKARKNQGATDTQSALRQLSGQAMAASNNNATETLGFELALTVAGVTNPGLATGAVLNRQIFNYDGVLSYWSILFASDPPIGADIIIDALINGSSIFPASDALRIVLPASQSTEAQGYLFQTNNFVVHKGDVLTLNVHQVGLTTPGSNGLVRIVSVH
jgi:hypothetical protein